MNVVMSERRSLRVLVVEDEPGDERLMQWALQQSSVAIEVHGVGDGYEALRFLRREGTLFDQAPRPDLILLDLKMPGLSGMEFLRLIKQEECLRAIPVVVVTTSMLDSDVLAAYQCGAAGYVRKPTDINEFVAAIEKLVRYWFVVARLPENPE
jgi:CheY-like chemotaxis protein